MKSDGLIQEMAMNPHDRLDEFKLRAAVAVLACTDMPTIRSAGLANLDRWASIGVWVSAHDEWRALLTNGTDDEIKHAMTSRDQNSNRLRQSPPYPGLLDEATRQRILSEVRLWDGA